MGMINDTNYKKAEFGKCFAILPDWLMKELDKYNLRAVDRLLYLCLYQHSDTNTGLCYPSYKVIKKYVGVQNNKSIKQGLDRLVDTGLILVVQKGHYSDGINKANTYKVNFLYPDDWLVTVRKSTSSMIST